MSGASTSDSSTAPDEFMESGAHRAEAPAADEGPALPPATPLDDDGGGVFIFGPEPAAPKPEPAPARRRDFGGADSASVGAVSAAASQTVRIGSAPPPPPAPSPTEHAEAAAPAEPRARRVGFQTIALVTVVAINVGLGAGIASLRHDERETRAPIAAMSAGMTTLQSSQAQADRRLKETRSRLDEHDALLHKTIERLNATEERQREARREARERAERETKELAALTARLGSVERKVDMEVRNVDEALKIINLLGEPASARSPESRSAKPSRTEHGTPAEGHAPTHPAPSAKPARSAHEEPARPAHEEPAHRAPAEHPKAEAHETPRS